jgi:tetratricopeptide (TPR) repeat protein
LTYARSVDSLSELASAENLLGGIYYRQCEWKAALHHTTRAMILREQMGYSWGVASTLGNLGILAVSAGHWSKARSFFERSLALRQEMGDVEGISIAHNNLGTLARDQGDLDLAEFHFNESLGVAIPFKIGFQAVNSNVGLAQVFLLKKEIDTAEEILVHSLNQAQEIGADDLLTEIFRIQAEIWLTKSAWDRAQEAARKSVALAADIGNRSLEVAAWRVLSEIELRRGDFPASRDAMSQAKTALEEANDELEVGRVAAQAGRMHLWAAQMKQAETELKTAQEIFMRLGASLELKQVEKALRGPSTPEEAAELGLRLPPVPRVPHDTHT